MDDDFTPLEQAAWGDLIGMYGRLMRRIDDHLVEKYGISHVEFEVLLRLSWAEGYRLRIQDLAARSMLTRSGMSRAVTRLEEAGLVSREEASEDRRGAYAILTPTGLCHFRAALKDHVAYVRRHFISLFSEKELGQMAAFWQRVLEQGLEGDDR